MNPYHGHRGSMLLAGLAAIAAAGALAGRGHGTPGRTFAPGSADKKKRAKRKMAAASRKRNRR